MLVILLFLTGLAAGGLGSILGLGGGIIIIPVLTILLDYPIKTAIGVSLIGVVATSNGASAVNIREGKTNIRLGMTLELATVVGALLGAYAAGWLNPKTLYFLFSLLTLYNAYSMYQKDRKNKENEAVAVDETQKDSFTVRNMTLGLFLSMIAGVLSALLGIGGGILKIPVMYFLMGIPLKVAAATSNFMIGITASTSAFVYFLEGMIDYSVAVPVALGVFTGSALGVRLGRNLSIKSLHKVFITVFVVIAVQMIYKGIRS